MTMRTLVGIFIAALMLLALAPFAVTAGKALAAKMRKQWGTNEVTPTDSAVSGDTSDGYHTFNELYAFRRVYNAALFNEWAEAGKHQVHKSTKHFDGEECFGGGWFIVSAMLPEGQISNHYRMKYWDQFQIPAPERSWFPYDGHTNQDVVTRLTHRIMNPK